MKNLKDIDFLQSSARVRAMEKYMVDAAALKRMIDAKTVEDAYKILTDKGIGASYPVEEYQKALNESLAETYRIVESISPSKDLVRIFRCKYDGHNLKTAVKSKASPTDWSHVYMDLGNVPLHRLLDELKSGRIQSLEPELAQAAREATDALAKTGDPQQVDIIIDKAVQTVMLRIARSTESKYLINLVQAQLDIANIRAFVRAKRMGKDGAFLREVLVEGGTVFPARLVECYPKSYEEFFQLLSTTSYGRALEPAADTLKSGGSLTQFEKLCDNYQMFLLREARFVPFGEAPLAAYLLAKEAEIQSVRIVIASRLAMVPAQQIEERLRDCYG